MGAVGGSWAGRGWAFWAGRGWGSRGSCSQIHCLYICVCIYRVEIVVVHRVEIVVGLCSCLCV